MRVFKINLIPLQDIDKLVKNDYLVSCSEIEQAKEHAQSKICGNMLYVGYYVENVGALETIGETK